MTFKTNMLCSAIVTVMIASPALAQMVDAAIDVDGDGVYSLDELQVAVPELSADAFAVIDANGDGVLDADEAAAAVEAGILPPTDG